jgi:hypothetical protein
VLYFNPAITALASPDGSQMRTVSESMFCSRFGLNDAESKVFNTVVESIVPLMASIRSLEQQSPPGSNAQLTALVAQKDALLLQGLTSLFNQARPSAASNLHLPGERLAALLAQR